MEVGRPRGHLCQGALTPGQVRVPAPTLGQHTEEVLRQFGVPEDETGEILGRG